MYVCMYTVEYKRKSFMQHVDKVFEAVDISSNTYVPHS